MSQAQLPDPRTNCLHPMGRSLFPEVAESGVLLLDYEATTQRLGPEPGHHHHIFTPASLTSKLNPEFI